MTIEKTMNGTTAELALNGWMDTQSAPQFAEAVSEIGEETEKLILEMKGLEYTSSAGVRQIIAAHKKMKGALVLRHVSPEVLDVLKMTGILGRLTIEE